MKLARAPRAAVRRTSAFVVRHRDSAAERAFDRRRRIDTAGVVLLSTTNYQPVHPKAFRDFLAYLPADRSRMTFVDYGSGRGRALFLAVEHGFASAIGVEIEPTHHEVATTNLATYRGPGGDRIRLIEGDARELPLPDGPVVVFLYNPFPRDVLAAVVAGVSASLRADPRPAWLIYEAPMDRDLIDADPRFKLLGERTERAGASPRRPRFAVYEARALT